MKIVIPAQTSREGNMLTFFYSLTLIIVSIYSYALIDPNITFFQTGWWVLFREKMIYFGYYRRDLSWLAYILLVSLLFLFHYLFMKNYKRINPLKISLLAGIITLIAYPFLSHDFLNYMFDARILTFYHQNPYLHKALDFPFDPWLRFMQWTHRTYPYGPVFLVITLVPSFFSFGKFVLSFIFFKFTFCLFYLLAVFLLKKIDKRKSLFFATHPLIIMEGLINSHNDLLAISLGIIGIYFLTNNNLLKSRFLFVLSTGIKFLTLPIVFLNKQNGLRNKLVFLAVFALISYLSIRSEVQPWYFLNLLIFLPWIQSINRLDLFLFGLLVSYYPYIRLGGWDSIYKVELKHTIIAIFAALNLIYLFFLHQEIFKVKKVQKK